MAAIIPHQDTGPQVLVATKSLGVGSIIDPTDFRYQPWPKDLVSAGYYLKDKTDPNKLNGTVVRQTVTAGEPLTEGSLISPGDRGFLAAALSPGMRAVTFSVKVTGPLQSDSSGTSGVAGFVFPGDRVDLILTQSIAGGKWQALRTSETIVRNLRVLATDQKITSVDDKGQRLAQPFTNVTVEASPRIAEKITVAQSLGSLSLSLRSIADNQADFDRAIATGKITLPKNSSQQDEQRAFTEFASQPNDDNVTFVTGGDVSHFQRKSVPAVASDDKPQIMPQLVSGGHSPRTARGVEPIIVNPEKERAAMIPPTVRISRGNATEQVSATAGGPQQ
ncbi:MAG: Flp pilus assembly protein CpaB, partial [Alphaproteobacteria bacterium]|nr:Flp pilus assembly protein CpaB [Alphaproteobacteria bacterium]